MIAIQKLGDARECRYGGVLFLYVCVLGGGVFVFVVPIRHRGIYLEL